MKKSLIISSILLLGVAMSAAPSSPLDLKGKLELLKKTKGISLPAINLVKREEACFAINCTEPGSDCAVESSFCKNSTRCLDDVCRVNVAGDPCDEDGECDGEFRCDVLTSKCVARLGVGESCTNDECETTLSCKNKVCTQGPSKAGDKCTSMFGFDDCPLGLTCSGGVCVTLPGVGEKCTESGDCAAGLICDLFKDICKKTPKAGEPCVAGFCSADIFSQEMYCDDSNVCRKPKGLGESCSSSVPCDTNYYECVNGKCKKYDTGGSCTSDNDCDGPQACFNGVCTEIFTLDEGAECPYSEQGASMGEAELFLCKEGLGCVPNRETGSGYVCKKIETKFDSELSCESDSDCPADSACKCNSATGAMQCYPYIVSSKKTYDLVYDYAMSLVSCFTGECDEKEIEKLTYKIAKLIDPNDPEVRCSDVSFDDSDSPSFAGQAFVMPLIYLVAVAVMFL